MILKRDRPKNNLLTDFYVIDTETKGLSARPESFLVGAIVSNGFKKVIYSVKEFQKELLKPRYKKKKIFAHHAEYDLDVIYNNIYLLDSNAVFNNRFIMATNGNAIFADSFNILLGSVEKIGKMTGLKKQFKKSDYDTFSIKTKVSKKLISGCVRDCEIIYYALLEIFELVGNIKITLAGLSLQYFRNYFQKFDIEHNEKFAKYFFNSYFGGRTEAFKIGKVNAICYDVNSMYVFMLLQKFPNPKFFKTKNKISLFEFRKMLQRYEGCAFISVNVPDQKFPPLPYRKDSKVFFPIGKFSGWYNFNELRPYIKDNRIKILKVHKIVYSIPMNSPFKDFAESVYNEKNKSTGLRQHIFKILSVSLYGKFGQRIDYDTMYCENLDDYIDFINWLKVNNKFCVIQKFSFDRLDGFIQYESQLKELSWGIPSFASYITSGGRVYLDSYLNRYSNYEPVYCDTDAIFFNGRPPIKDGHNLGEWKLEKKIITNIRGLKDYSFIQDKKLIVRIKGIKKDSIPLDKINSKFKYKSMVKTKESLRRKIPAGTFIERIKVISHEYDKRIVLSNGDTKPINL